MITPPGDLKEIIKSYAIKKSKNIAYLYGRKTPVWKGVRIGDSRSRRCSGANVKYLVLQQLGFG